MLVTLSISFEHGLDVAAITNFNFAQNYMLVQAYLTELFLAAEQ